MTQLKAALVEKEREMCWKVQSARDEEFRKTVQLQQEKSVKVDEKKGFSLLLYTKNVFLS